MFPKGEHDLWQYHGRVRGSHKPGSQRLGSRRLVPGSRFPTTESHIFTSLRVPSCCFESEAPSAIAHPGSSLFPRCSLCCRLAGT